MPTGRPYCSRGNYEHRYFSRTAASEPWRRVPESSMVRTQSGALSKRCMRSSATRSQKCKVCSSSMQAQPQSWKRLSSSLAPITVRQGVRRRWAQERGGGYRSAGDPLARSSCDDNSRGNRRGKNRRAHPVFEQAGTGLMLGAGSNDSHRLIKEKTAKYGGLSFDVEG